VFISVDKVQRGLEKLGPWAVFHDKVTRGKHGRPVKMCLPADGKIEQKVTSLTAERMGRTVALE